MCLLFRHELQLISKWTTDLAKMFRRASQAAMVDSPNCQIAL
jgi:hypothetical protein